MDDFKARGLEFRSLEERLDISSAVGELVFHVFGAIAQPQASIQWKLSPFCERMLVWT